jgi:hypothetical protein
MIEFERGIAHARLDRRGRTPATLQIAERHARLPG